MTRYSPSENYQALFSGRICIIVQGASLSPGCCPSFLRSGRIYRVFCILYIYISCYVARMHLWIDAHLFTSFSREAGEKLKLDWRAAWREIASSTLAGWIWRRKMNFCYPVSVTWSIPCQKLTIRPTPRCDIWFRPRVADACMFQATFLVGINEYIYSC